jgi:hypothetical protein
MWLEHAWVTDRVFGRRRGMGAASGELEQRKAKGDSLACPITTTLTASSGVNRDQE